MDKLRQLYVSAVAPDKGVEEKVAAVGTRRSHGPRRHSGGPAASVPPRVPDRSLWEALLHRRLAGPRLPQSRHYPPPR